MSWVLGHPSQRGRWGWGLRRAGGCRGGASQRSSFLRTQADAAARAKAAADEAARKLGELKRQAQLREQQQQLLLQGQQQGQPAGGQGGAQPTPPAPAAAPVGGDEPAEPMEIEAAGAPGGAAGTPAGAAVSGPPPGPPPAASAGMPALAGGALPTSLPLATAAALGREVLQRPDAVDDPHTAAALAVAAATAAAGGPAEAAHRDAERERQRQRNEQVRREMEGNAGGLAGGQGGGMHRRGSGQWVRQRGGCVPGARGQPQQHMLFPRSPCPCAFFPPFFPPFLPPAVRYEPLGMDRRYNRYWRFVAPGIAPDGKGGGGSATGQHHCAAPREMPCPKGGGWWPLLPCQAQGPTTRSILPAAAAP